MPLDTQHTEVRLPPRRAITVTLRGVGSTVLTLNWAGTAVPGRMVRTHTRFCLYGTARS